MSKNLYIYKKSITLESLKKAQLNHFNPFFSEIIKLNPPKKNNMKKAESIITKAGLEEKDIISSDPSFSKQYKSPSSDISYESYKEEKPILIDTLLEYGERLQNNYIGFPKEIENKIIFNNIKNSIYISEENEDDENEKKIYLSDINEDDSVIKNSKKKSKRNNKKIIKLIDKDDIIEEDESKKGYNSDNNEINKFNKNKRKSKNIQNSENELDSNFSNSLINRYKNPKKSTKNNPRISKRKDTNDDQDNPNDLIKSKKSIIITKVITNEEPNINAIKKTKTKKLVRHSINEENKKNAFDVNEKPYENSENKNKRKTDSNNEEKKSKNSKLELTEENININKDEANSTYSKRTNKSFKSSENQEGLSKKNSKINLYSGKKKRYNLNFEEEEEKIGDTAVPQGEKILQNIEKSNKGLLIKNSQELIENKNKEKEISDKKSDFQIFNENALGSSLSSFLEENPLDKKLKTDVHFFKFYWRYFKKRELILVSFIDSDESIPYFVRWSCFIFCLFFLFMLNCFFFFESKIHDRFINASNGGKNDIKYYFKHEFVFSIYTSLIYIVFKMIIIKLVLNRALKIKNEVKIMMAHSYENGLNEKELEEIKNIRVTYLVKYHIRLIIYFLLMLALSILFAYICICYSEIFKNSISSILYGFVFSIIFSFILCAIICLIIIIIYKIGKKCKNRCLLSTFIVLSTMY